MSGFLYTLLTVGRSIDVSDSTSSTQPPPWSGIVLTLFSIWQFITTLLLQYFTVAVYATVKSPSNRYITNVLFFLGTLINIGILVVIITEMVYYYQQKLSLNFYLYSQTFKSVWTVVFCGSVMGAAIILVFPAYVSALAYAVRVAQREKSKLRRTATPSVEEGAVPLQSLLRRSFW